MNGTFGSPSPDAAVYVISVAAELTGLHPQTLRAYERMGLIQPAAPGAAGLDQPHPLVGAERLRVQAGQLGRNADDVHSRVRRGRSEGAVHSKSPARSGLPAVAAR